MLFVSQTYKQYLLFHIYANLFSLCKDTKIIFLWQELRLGTGFALRNGEKVC
jgi:hypothetical protein